MSSVDKQSATYTLFSIGHDIRFLKCRCVDKSAYSVLNKIYSLINTLNPEDFSEDSDGNIISELVPTSKPSWKDKD